MKRFAVILSLLGFSIALPALAVCPVCTVAVVAGVGLSRWLGVDDTITGVWIGGLTVSLIIWTIDWFNQKKIYFWGKKTITTIGYYLLVVLPLFFIPGVINHPLNKIWGVDKLLLGITLGSAGFLAAALSYPILKKKNGGKPYFPFQKAAMPIAALIILSIIFYFLTKR
ncbi:MAG: hypothetical protein M1334_00255 [Patescibacteria group bacterium]|nr:hypothetical protein [Patescibacteria group bacterium]